MEKENKEKKEDKKIVKFVKELIPYIIIVIVVLFVKNYIVAPIQVNGESMESTLLDGDIMILNRLAYKRHGVERFDIVVIKINDTKIIKRIIGMPGDIVEVIDNVLYINGEMYKEEYLDKDTVTEDFSLKELFDIEKVPENTYFVLGDNRDRSMDSRNPNVGLINASDIEGIASFTIFPINRFGTKE